MAERILIVDDEAPIRVALERMLLRSGYEVKLACDGMDALRIMLEEGRATAFDLMIMDVQMPGLTGVELVEKLRTRGICPPVLPIAGALNEETYESLSAMGCPVPLEKPFSRGELIDRVERMLSDA